MAVQDVDPEDIIARADALKSARATWDAQWQDIRDHIMPVASGFNRAGTSGTKDRSRILDNTGEHAADMLVGALVSLLTPNTQDFFQLATEDQDLNRRYAVAAWLEACTQRVHQAFRRPPANFTGHQQEKIADVVAFGTGAGFIALRRGLGIRFSSVPLHQCFLSEDADGVVDTVYRDFTLTARQAVAKWGDRVGEKVAKAAAERSRQDDPFRFVHAVFPRSDVDPDRRDGASRPFAAAYVCADDKVVLDEDGYHEMPYQTPRWWKRSEEIYGRGCGLKALADVCMAQRMTATVLSAAEKMVDPPLMVADDGIIGKVRLAKGGITYYRSGMMSTDPVKALVTGARPDIGEDHLVGVRARIENAFLKPLIMMIRKDRMTATEVLHAADEAQRIMAPYVGRLLSEDLGPMIGRVFNILLREGALPPPPPDLQGQVLRIEYVNPAVRQQRIGTARALSQLVEMTMPLAQVRPDVMDNIDFDQSIRVAGDALGLPKTCLRDPDAVDAMRQARAEAQAQQAKAEQTMAAVDTAANAVRALPALRQATEGRDAA